MHGVVGRKSEDAGQTRRREPDDHEGVSPGGRVSARGPGSRIRDGAHREGRDPHHTDVCIAALGTDCVQGYKDENFFGNWNKKVITVVIQAFVPKNPAITSVSHNGVTMDADTCKNAGDCVLSITYDNQGKFYTIVLTSGTNGFYDF